MQCLQLQKQGCLITLPAVDGTGLTSDRGRFVRLERCERMDPDLDLHEHLASACACSIAGA